MGFTFDDPRRPTAMRSPRKADDDTATMPGARRTLCSADQYQHRHQALRRPGLGQRLAGTLFCARTRLRNFAECRSSTLHRWRGGKQLSGPTHTHHRYVINVSGLSPPRTHRDRLNGLEQLDSARLALRRRTLSYARTPNRPSASSALNRCISKRLHLDVGHESNRARWTIRSRWRHCAGSFAGPSRSNPDASPSRVALNEPEDTPSRGPPRQSPGNISCPGPKGQGR